MGFAYGWWGPPILQPSRAQPGFEHTHRGTEQNTEISFQTAAPSPAPPLIYHEIAHPRASVYPTAATALFNLFYCMGVACSTLEVQNTLTQQDQSLLLPKVGKSSSERTGIIAFPAHCSVCRQPA